MSDRPKRGGMSVAKDARAIPPQTSESTTDSHSSCYRWMPGRVMTQFAGNMRIIEGKEVPKDRPFLLHSCPCDYCIDDLDAMGLFS